MSATAGTPALTVTLPNPVPNAVISGTTIKKPVTVNIANDGTGIAREKASISLFASLDTTLSSDDAALGTITRNINIAPQHNQNINIRLNPIPQNLDGNYYILASVNGALPSVVGASIGQINISPPNIDLQPNVLKTPAKARVGKAITFVVQVANNGNSDLNAPLDVAIGLSQDNTAGDAVSLGTTTLRHVHIKAHGHITIHVRILVPLGSPTGNQYLVVTLDPQNKLLDINPGNNTSIGEVPIVLS
ncbi:MAG TPA: CARDB domain-containing protein [Tepidisphaeraceae bacterium]|nr:CARDB domain-containing protein [Tepidisphaeraceae bacterium]